MSNYRYYVVGDCDMWCIEYPPREWAQCTSRSIVIACPGIPQSSPRKICCRPGDGRGRAGRRRRQQPGKAFLRRGPYAGSEPR
jgi:hypothetical protein